MPTQKVIPLLGLGDFRKQPVEVLEPAQNLGIPQVFVQRGVVAVHGDPGAAPVDDGDDLAIDVQEAVPELL